LLRHRGISGLKPGKPSLVHEIKLAQNPHLHRGEIEAEKSRQQHKKQMNQISFMTICFDGAAARFSAGVMIDVWRVLF